MPKSPVRPWQPDSNKIASGKPGAVQSVLCLEIAKLEQAMQTFDRPFASVSNSTLDLGEGEELGVLEVVKIGQAVKRCMLGLRQHG